MMKFDNAFMCKSGVVGMQFTNKNRDVLSVFHDGKQLRTSEGFSDKEQQAALTNYNNLLPKYADK